MTGRVLITLLRPFIRFFHPYRVTGAENLDAAGERVILCSNHLSNWDPVLTLLCQPRRVRFMAKEELFRFKPLGAILQNVFGAFPVARGKGDTGALDIACAIVGAGEIMGIYPEGTRSRSGKLMRFKSGASLIASRTDATVVPCGIDRRSRPFKKVNIVFGKPITPQEMHLTGEKPDLRFATRLMRERVQALTGQEDAL